MKREGNGEGNAGIDEDLNSRNLFAYGMDAMNKMAGSSVAVVGLNGVGAEAAKCLILANVGTVTLVDDAIVAMKDLSTHFYLCEKDIGRNRADACYPQLQELNPNVAVRVHNQPVTPALFAQHHAVVVCDGSLSQHIEWNGMCRALHPPVAFVLAEARGVCFRLFSDFGPAPYQCIPGHSPYCFPVAKIDPAAAGLATVTVVSEADTRPSRDDVVTFSDIPCALRRDGLPEAFRVASMPQQQAGRDSNLWRFEVEPISCPGQEACQMDACAGRGHIKQLISPQTFSFSSLAHCLQDPGNLSSRAWKQFAFDGRSEQLHVAFAAFHQYAQLGNVSHPLPRLPSDIDAYMRICKSVFSSFPDFAASYGAVDEELMRLFARSFTGLLSPIAAIAGAFAAQEAIKRCSQKYIPVCNPQWFYFDALDSLPDVSESQDPTDFEPQNCRYDDQIVLLGRSMQALLGNSNVFVIGAGAIGCEILKNFAMMGVACGEHGLLTITDNDHIEKSNLSRQFLFRSHHIKKSKSECASESVRLMNQHFK
jgi:ubiquitin-activating enzyme E1